MPHPMDDLEILHNLFHVRKTQPHTHPDKDNVRDGHIKVDDDVQLGYRLYLHTSIAPILLYFHGNGEIASDYEGIASFYNLSGVSLLVVDYRGYGWSTGTPLTTRLLPDAEIVLEKLPDVLTEQGIMPGRPLFVKGRSLGSAPAIYLAKRHADVINGLIIESGYADAPSLFRRLGIDIPDQLAEDDTLPVNNVGKMRAIDLPLLVIHGAVDTLIPVIHGRDLYDASPSPHKALLIIEGAGHNNLLVAGTAKYFDTLKRFIEAYQ